MPTRKLQTNTRLQLSDERRADLVAAIKAHFAAEFDEPLSDFRAEALLDFFLKTLGPSVYNQGVRDAARAMQAKLIDLDAEIYAPEN
jgi:uncharacterized protein (DUF2164 family)